MMEFDRELGREKSLIVVGGCCYFAQIVGVLI